MDGIVSSGFKKAVPTRSHLRSRDYYFLFKSPMAYAQLAISRFYRRNTACVRIVERETSAMQLHTCLLASM